MGRKKVAYGLACLVSCIAFVVYLPALRNHFLLWDDDLYIVNNPFIKSFNSGLFRSAFFDFYANNWHPLMPRLFSIVEISISGLVTENVPCRITGRLALWETPGDATQ